MAESVENGSARQRILSRLYAGAFASDAPPARDTTHLAVSPVATWEAFAARAAANAFDVQRAESPEAARVFIEAWLRRHNLPQRVRIPPAMLQESPSSSAATVALAQSLCHDSSAAGVAGRVGEIGEVEADDLTALTCAQLAIAESGSVVHTGEIAHATHFLPPNVIVLLPHAATQVVASLDNALELLAAPSNSPRLMNIVSGPSRTGDIDLSVQLGIHGPLRVLVIGLGTAREC